MAYHTIEETYRGLSDSELRRLLRQPPESFEPEAYRILRLVAKERGLDKQVEEEMAREQMPVTEQMVRDLIAKRDSIQCPVCGRKDGTFNIHVFFRVVFVYVWVIVKKQVIVGCRSCREEQLGQHVWLYRLLLLLLPVQTAISFAYLLYFHRLLQRIASDNSPTEYLAPFLTTNYWRVIEGKALADTEPENGRVVHI